MSFEKYLIEVGIRSIEFTYSQKKLNENIEYFRFCKKKGLSPYKALLFLTDHLKEKNS